MSGAAATAETTEETLDFGAWKPTGRKTVGLDSELVELENPDGHKQTAIVFDKPWRGNPHLTTDVELVQSFMEFPMVEGISCLTRWMSDSSVFQYETGSVLALIEVLRAYRDQRKPVGLRAAVDLLRATAQMLQEASENGPMQGIYSHGGITPWRVLLDADGAPQLIGYGLPQMDMVALRSDESLKVRDDSFKYCPPERLTSGYEDITTDLYSLVLIAHEMVTGDALLQGRSDDLKRQVVMGEAHQKLMASKATYPRALHDVFVQCLAYDPIGRFEQPWQFSQALDAAVSGAPVAGESLAEVMTVVRGSTRRGKALMDVGTAGGPRRTLGGPGERETKMKSALAARPVRAPTIGGRPGAAAGGVSGDGRWGKVARHGAAEEEEETTSRRGAVAGRPNRRRGAEPEEPAAPERSSRLRRGHDDDDAPVRGRRGEPDAPVRGRGAVDDDASSVRSRLRRSASDDVDDAGSVRGRLRRGAAEETPADDGVRSRLRGSASRDEAPADDGVRSRLRRSAAADDAPADDGVRSRLRRSAATEEPPADGGVRSRLRGSASRDEAPVEDAAPARSRRAAAEEAPVEDAAPVRSRRAAAAEAPAEEAAPVRSRRAAPEPDAAEDAAPARGRRPAAADDPPADHAAPVRSRRGVPETDDADPPVRSRRRGD
jgi:hypothetical protein